MDMKPERALKSAGLQKDEALTTKAENGRGTLCRSFSHKTLEERAAEYDGNLNLSGEIDWRGKPIGNELW